MLGVLVISKRIAVIWTVSIKRKQYSNRGCTRVWFNDDTFVTEKYLSTLLIPAFPQPQSDPHHDQPGGIDRDIDTKSIYVSMPGYSLILAKDLRRPCYTDNAELL